MTMKGYCFKPIVRFFKCEHRTDAIAIPSSESGDENATHGLAPSRSDPLEPLRIVFDFATQGGIGSVSEPTSKSNSTTKEESDNSQDLPPKKEGR